MGNKLEKSNQFSREKLLHVLSMKTCFTRIYPVLYCTHCKNIQNSSPELNSNIKKL